MSVLLDLQIIREDVIPTSPPTVERLSVFSFTSGEKRTLALQSLNAYNKRPYLLPIGWIASLELPTLDPDVPLVKSMTIDSLDRSIMTVVLSSIETASIIGGKIKLTISEIADPTNKMIASKNGLIAKNNKGGCC